MSGDKDTTNKKNNINVQHKKWTKDNKKGEEDNYTD